MSLISLTFGKGKEMPSYSQIEVARPCDNIHAEPGVENRVEVKKACTFFKDNGTYLVCSVVSGVVKEGMVAECNGKQFRIEEVESRLGSAAKQGMNAGISVSGISPFQIKSGDVISLSPPQ